MSDPEQRTYFHLETDEPYDPGVHRGAGGSIGDEEGFLFLSPGTIVEPALA